MRKYPSDIAFTPAVKGILSRNGSRASYAWQEWGTGAASTSQGLGNGISEPHAEELQLWLHCLQWRGNNVVNCCKEH